jgi:hypothetical protein
VVAIERLAIVVVAELAEVRAGICAGARAGRRLQAKLGEKGLKVGICISVARAAAARQAVVGHDGRLQSLFETKDAMGLGDLGGNGQKGKLDFDGGSEEAI